MTRWSWVLVGAVVLGGAAGAEASVEVFQRGAQTMARFRYQPPQNVTTVHVAGSFNDWSLQDRHMLRDNDGDRIYELEVELRPGRYTYKFVVDGNQWLQDPSNDVTEADGHGGFNSVVEVGGHGGGQGGEGGQGGQGGQGPAAGGDDRPVTGGGFGGTTQTRRPHFTGRIVFVPEGTQRLPNIDELESVGEIFSETFDVAPQPFSEGFPGLSERFEWFAIRYRGTFHAERTGLYRFRILSDDASRMFIDGRLVIDNDGLHEPRSVEQRVRLREGDYDLVIDYMQGPALDVALQVWVTPPGSTVEQLLRASR